MPLISIFLSVINTVFPLSILRPKKRVFNKWYTSDLRILKQRCLFYYDLYKQYGNYDYKCKYAELKHLYRNSLNSAKSKYFTNFINNSHNKSKVTWNVISSVINTNHRGCIKDAHLNANEINSFFY